MFTILELIPACNLQLKLDFMWLIYFVTLKYENYLVQWTSAQFSCLKGKPLCDNLYLLGVFKYIYIYLGHYSGCMSNDFTGKQIYFSVTPVYSSFLHTFFWYFVWDACLFPLLVKFSKYKQTKGILYISEYFLVNQSILKQQSHVHLFS